MGDKKKKKYKEQPAIAGPGASASEIINATTNAAAAAEQARRAATDLWNAANYLNGLNNSARVDTAPAGAPAAGADDAHDSRGRGGTGRDPLNLFGALGEIAFGATGIADRLTPARRGSDEGSGNPLGDLRDILWLLQAAATTHHDAQP